LIFKVIKLKNVDSKQIWKTLKEAIKNHPNNKNKTLQIEINNIMCTNEAHLSKIAEYFNEYFANITTKDANN
jgi:myo-inositol-1-phosphate synthase